MRVGEHSFVCAVFCGFMRRRMHTLSVTEWGGVAPKSKSVTPLSVWRVQTTR